MWHKAPPCAWWAGAFACQSERRSDVPRPHPRRGAHSAPIRLFRFPGSSPPSLQRSFWLRFSLLRLVPPALLPSSLLVSSLLVSSLLPPFSPPQPSSSPTAFSVSYTHLTLPTNRE